MERNCASGVVHNRLYQEPHSYVILDDLDDRNFELMRFGGSELML